MLIAGKEEDITKDQIEEETASYRDKVTVILDYLDEDRFAMCLNCSDIIVLPYRKKFDGASGPLGEGVAIGKMVVGPNHGSLGQIIRDNHLGFTFEAENEDDLCAVLEEAINSDWTADDRYIAYQELLSPRRFQADYKRLYDQIANS